MLRKLTIPSLVSAIAVLIGTGSVAHAQCQVPLIIGIAGSTANVLILLDNSASMNEIVMHDAYNPATNYSGNFTGTSSYNIAVDGTYTPRSFNAVWPTTPSAYLVNSDQGQSGVYTGNYLNWVYFHATATQRAAIPAVTKIQVAKQVVNNVLSTVTSCRFAVEIFNGQTGGTIIAPFGTSISSMQSSVNNINANAYTPLAESMETALNYFKTTDSNAPFQAACQKSFIIVITDGAPTQDTGISTYLKSWDCAGNDPGNCSTLSPGLSETYNCRAYLDNVACYMYRNDLRADLDGIQNVATFTIGFSIDHPLLQATADVGGGDYYTTNNASGLLASLNATFQTIDRRVAAGAAVSVVSSEDRMNNRLYRARYESGTWRGYVESYGLPFHTGVAPLWESGALLSAMNPDSRTILTTSTGTNTIAFSSANAATLMSQLGAADVTTATNIIQYVRGNAISGTRDRGGWILGDIVDAAPVAVGKPTGFNGLPGYASFRTANANRTEVLYVAANDGMMHCFNTTTGAEMWGYVPKSQLGRVKDLMSTSYCHEYFVNATPAVYDIPINSTWKTVLFGGVERGGNGLFALDITNPSSVSVLWDVDIPRIKGTWNPPTLVRDRNRSGYVLCLGTGYDSNTSADTLVVIDPADGSRLARVGLGSAVAGNKTTKATALDTNFDGWDDLLYIADLAGRLWRVNLTTNPWTVTQLFAAGKPIQAPPIASLDNYGRPMVFFGTGQFISDTDPSVTSTQSIYCVVDDGTGTTFTPADLANQTSAINAMTTSTHGWRLDLTQASGERVTRSAALINGTLYVPSFQPSPTGCGGAGQSWVYALDYKDGSAPDNTNGTANNTTNNRVQSMGDGILADPTVDLVNEAVLLQSSNAVVISQSIAGGLKKLLVRGWHQDWK